MKGLHKSISKGLVDATSWVEENKYALSHKDEISASTKIIMKLISYMEIRDMSQSDMARVLNVSPQYIHKLLHGQDYSFLIDTAIEYGKKLNIKLVDIPEDEVDCAINVFFNGYSSMGCELNEDKLTTSQSGENYEFGNFKTMSLWNNNMSLSFA